MLKHHVYLIWLLLFMALPILGLFVYAPRAIWRQARAIGLTLGVAFLGGWAWDKLAIHLGAWQFDPNSILGRWIGGLPVEEWCWIGGATVLFGAVTVLCADRFERGCAQAQGVSARGEERSATALEKGADGDASARLDGAGS
ncbi:MAG TPA: lycopene cyclase domain-containing protein [Isosphaeraceae bacterium]|nr:lycopene cyclase domain-containing protein [Isosphaeraceae bacterium]